MTTSRTWSFFNASSTWSESRSWGATLSWAIARVETFTAVMTPPAQGRSSPDGVPQGPQPRVVEGPGLTTNQHATPAIERGCRQGGAVRRMRGPAPLPAGSRQHARIDALDAIPVGDRRTRHIKCSSETDHHRRRNPRLTPGLNVGHIRRRHRDPLRELGDSDAFLLTQSTNRRAIHRSTTSRSHSKRLGSNRKVCQEDLGMNLNKHANTPGRQVARTLITAVGFRSTPIFWATRQLDFPIGSREDYPRGGLAATR